MLPPGLGWGCGVTAYSEEDAITILKEDVFSSYEYVDPIEIIRDVDIRTLDQNHVVPNMGAPVFRGVWFPMGY